MDKVMQYTFVLVFVSLIQCRQTDTT